MIVTNGKFNYTIRKCDGTTNNTQQYNGKVNQTLQQYLICVSLQCTVWSEMSTYIERAMGNLSLYGIHIAHNICIMPIERTYLDNMLRRVAVEVNSLHTMLDKLSSDNLLAQCQLSKR